MAKQKKISKRTVIKFQKGQEKAFNEIYNTYKDRFYFMAYHFLRNESDAADAVQEIFLQLIHDIKDLKHPEAFHVWAYRIAYHICLHTVSQKSFNVQEQTSIEDYEDSHMNISNQAIHKEINETVLEIIQTMPSSLQAVCLLRFYEQLSMKEIAVILDISENAVKLRIRRARNYIKDKLEEKGMSPDIISSALDPKAMLLLFITIQQTHQLSANVSKSIVTSITAQTVFTTGTTVSTSTMTISVLVTLIGITSGILFYNDSQKEEPAPVIQEAQDENSQIITVHYPQDYTNQPISIEVETTNKNYDSITINNKNTTTINTNGTYTISLIKDNKTIDSKEITIHTIDTSSPDKQSITKDGDLYTIVFKDNLSMVDKNSIEIYEDDKKINTYTFDEKTQTLQLHMNSQYLYRINLADKAGNYTYLTTTSE